MRQVFIWCWNNHSDWSVRPAHIIRFMQARDFTNDTCAYVIRRIAIGPFLRNSVLSVPWKYRFILIYTGKMCSSCLYRRHVVTEGCFLLSSLTLIVVSCLFLYRIDHSSEIRCVRRVYQPCLEKDDWEVNRKWEIIFRSNLLLIYRFWQFYDYCLISLKNLKIV